MILPNPLRKHKTIVEKISDYNKACANNAVAYSASGKCVPLRDVPATHVEFIGGLWRVQNDSPYEITMIRDQEMILGKKLNYTEKTYFTYYQARKVAFNCYGVLGNCFDMVVAAYATDDGIEYGYGKTIPDARAFLGIKLYDKYSDLINKVATQKINNRTR